MSTRVGNITCEQRSLLLEFLKQNPKLLSGKFSNDFTYKSAQTLWQNISTELNAIPGAKKDWRQWRKTWQDMQTKTKGKKSKINKHYSGTGGGEQTKEILTPAEIKILDLISPVEVDGHPVLESSTDFQYEFDNVEVIYEDTHVELNNTSNCENTIVTQISMPVACASTPSNVINNPHTEVSDKNNSRNDATPNKGSIAKSKTNVSSHRLQQSAEASNRLAAACEKKISLKANYYEQKLKLLQDKNIIMGQLVKTLQSISEKM